MIYKLMLLHLWRMTKKFDRVRNIVNKIHDGEQGNK